MKNNESVHGGGHLKKYLKHTPWYLLSSLTTKAMGFLLIPLLTNYLSPIEYGTLSTVEAIGRVLPIFIALYLDSAFNRFYFKEKAVSQERVSKLYSTHFWFIVFWGTLIGGGAFYIFPLVLRDLSEVSSIVIFVLIITQLFNQLAVMVTMIWNANLLAKKLAIFQVIMSFIAVFLTWYLLTVESLGWESRLYALGLVSVVQLAILLYIAIKNSWLTLSFNKEILLRSLKFSIPLLPNIAAGWIALSSDRLILAYFGKVDQVGLYSVAAQIAILMYVFNDAITKVQTPVAMSGLTDDKTVAKRKMASFLVGYFTLISMVYCLLVLFSREILYYFTADSFHDAYVIVMILGGVYFASGVYRVFTNIISFHNATWIISIAAFIQAIVNIVLNFIFIPHFGMYAAALSTLLSMLAYTFWLYYWAQKLDRIEFDKQAVVKILILVMSLILSSLAIDTYFVVGIELFLFKALIFTLFFVTLVSLKSSYKIKMQFVSLINSAVIKSKIK